MTLKINPRRRFVCGPFTACNHKIFRSELPEERLVELRYFTYRRLLNHRHGATRCPSSLFVSFLSPSRLFSIFFFFVCLFYLFIYFFSFLIFLHTFLLLLSVQH